MTPNSNYDLFAAYFAERRPDLVAHDRGAGHWQLRRRGWKEGEPVLNWWPWSRRKTVYVQDWPAEGRPVSVRDTRTRGVVDVSQVERIAGKVLK
jgi:hypothetical protein